MIIVFPTVTLSSNFWLSFLISDTLKPNELLQLIQFNKYVKYGIQVCMHNLNISDIYKLYS